MNLERNTLTTLREMCSREPELFRGYSRLRKNELVQFMEEKINTQTVMRLDDDDGEETDIEIENAQGEEILEVFEDFGEQSEQSMDRALIIENNILQDIENIPPVGPPAYPPPPPPQLEEIAEEIKHRMHDLVMQNFPQIEILELTEEMQKKEVYKKMQFKEFYDLIFYKWWVQERNMQIFITIMNEELLDNEFGHELTDFFTETMVEHARETLIDFMWDTLELEGPECPVCYECKPGLIVETQCKHNVCFTCLNESWKARWGQQIWRDRPCPMCRAEITEIKFL